MVDIQTRTIDEQFDPEIVDDAEFIEDFPVVEIVTRPKSEAREVTASQANTRQVIVWFKERYPDISGANRIEDFSTIEEIAFRFLEGNTGTFDMDVPVSFIINGTIGAGEEKAPRTREVKAPIQETQIYEIMMNRAGNPESFEEACRIIVQKGKEREAASTVNEMASAIHDDVQAAE